MLRQVAILKRRLEDLHGVEQGQAEEEAAAARAILAAASLRGQLGKQRALLATLQVQTAESVHGACPVACTGLTACPPAKARGVR